MAKRRGLTNFSVLVSHVLVPPAIEAIMSSPGNQVQAFLAAGHVCSVMGYWEYPPLAEQYRVPIVVTGFEPLDLLEGIRRAVLQLEAGAHEVENAYARIVTLRGQSGGAEAAGRGLRSDRPRMARHRRHPAKRLAAERGVSRLRRGSSASTSPASTPRSRRCAMRAKCCAGSSSPPSARLRQGVHAAPSARRNHGLERRRMRRVLQLRPIYVG